VHDFIILMNNSIGCGFGKATSLAPGQGHVDHMAKVTRKLTTNADKMDRLHVRLLNLTTCIMSLFVPCTIRVCA
jgi:hypothetical protein